MVTMADVARAASVSVSTVSHVINGTRPVNPGTSVRVMTAIEATGYRRNGIARSLARQKTQMVGIAISAMTNPYFGPLVGAMNLALETAGYGVLLGDTGDDPERERTVINRLLDHRVDGLILAPSGTAESQSIEAIRRSRTPAVLVDRPLDLGMDQVTSENRGPVAELVSHLAGRGLTSIAAVSGKPGLATTSERLDGYLDALRTHGLATEERLVVCGQSRTDTAYRVVTDLFSSPRRPEGLVVLNNAMTIGSLRALRDLGLGVPDDVALVCYDDFEWADLFSPRLTAMRQGLEVMGETVVELMLSRIAEPDGPIRHHKIAPTFVHRDSCGCHGPHS